MNRSNERKEFLGDIITTAVEGGIGYWALTSYYQYADIRGFINDKPGEVTVCIDDWNSPRPSGSNRDSTYAVIYEQNDDGEIDSTKPLILSYDTIAKGLRKTIEYYESAYDKCVGERYKHANRENDASYFDSIDVDVIAQFATLGELVYG